MVYSLCLLSGVSLVLLDGVSVVFLEDVSIGCSSEVPTAHINNLLNYGGHAAIILVYFIFRGARAEDRTRDCLTARRATRAG